MAIDTFDSITIRADLEAELRDARTDYAGAAYGSAGAAIRGGDSKVLDAARNLNDATQAQVDEFAEQYDALLSTHVVSIEGEWSATRSYNKFSVVTDSDGNSYTARVDVPAGTPLTNTDYWALTADYSAQMEQLRQDVGQYAGNVEELSNELGQEVETREALSSTVDALENGFVDFSNSSGNVIYKVPEEKVTQLFTVNDIPDGYYAQGMCVNGSSVYIGATNSQNQGWIGKYNLNGQLVLQKQHDEMRHANGFYYFGGRVYVATITNGVVVLNASTLEIEKTVSVTGYSPVGISVAQRSYSQSGISGSANYYYILTNNGNLLEVAHNIVSRIQPIPGSIHTQQGMCVKNNVMMLPRSVNYYAAGNVIDLFDLFGNRICGILLPMIGELEDCDISSDGRTMYFNISNVVYSANVESVLPTYLNDVIEAQQGVTFALPVTVTQNETNTTIPQTITIPTEGAIAYFNNAWEELSVTHSASPAIVKKRVGNSIDIETFINLAAYMQVQTLHYDGAFSSGKLVFTLNPEQSFITRINNNGTVERGTLASDYTKHFGTYDFKPFFTKAFRRGITIEFD